MSARVSGLPPGGGDEPGRSVAQPSSAPRPPEEPTPEELESDIEGIRENLGGLISELDERRHRLNPVRIARANPLAVAVGGVLLLGLCVGGVAWRMSRARRARGLSARIDRLRHAVGGAVAGSELRPPAPRPRATMMTKILTAAGTAVAAVAARRLTETAFAHARSTAAHRSS